MSFFKFFHGKSCDVPEPLPLPGIGLINDFYENGINTLGYEPYGMYKSGILFQSDICHRSYEEWRHLIDNNPNLIENTSLPYHQKNHQKNVFIFMVMLV